jgi:hypothetical protein
MPRNLLERHGRELEVPVSIDDPRTKDINRFDLTILHDTAALTFLGCRPGAIADTGWSITQSVRGNAVRLRGISTVGPFTEAGELLILKYRVAFGGGEEALKVTGSEILFDTLVSSLNEGSVIGIYYPGYATLSGVCNYPDSANDRYVIVQARPNPGADRVEIAYAVPEAGAVKLKVYDMFGRLCASRAGEIGEKGMYSATMDVTRFRAGTYFCVVEGKGFRGFCRFIVSR